MFQHELKIVREGGQKIKNKQNIWQEEKSELNLNNMTDNQLANWSRMYCYEIIIWIECLQINPNQSERKFTSKKVNGQRNLVLKERKWLQMV